MTRILSKPHPGRAPASAGDFLDTLPKLLFHHAASRPAATALRYKALGIWNVWTWERLAAEVRLLARALAAQGFAPGDRLLILGDPRPRLLAGLLAVQTLGGVAVPLPAGTSAAFLARVVTENRIRLALAQGPDEAESLGRVRDGLPSLSAVILDDGRGADANGGTTSLDGQAALDDYSEAGGARDLAVVIHTGLGRKGVELSHGALIAAARAAIAHDGLTPADETILLTADASAASFLFGPVQWLVAGFVLNHPEGPDTLLQDLREIGPSYLAAPSRVFAALRDHVLTRMHGAGPLKRRLFDRYLASRPGDGLGRILGHAVIGAPLADGLGLSRLRTATAYGDSLPPPVSDFFRALGLPLKTAYGTTEAAGLLAFGRPGAEPGALGPAISGIELELSADGELRFRGATAFSGYAGDVQASAAAVDGRGWIATGDLGVRDGADDIRLVGRRGEILHLADGAAIDPLPLETALRGIRAVRDAVVLGDGHRFIVALLALDGAAAAQWAAERGLVFSDPQSLAALPQLQSWLVGQVRLALAALPSGARPRRIALLPAPLSEEAEEVTATGRPDRGVIAARHRALVAGLYAPIPDIASIVEVSP